MAKYNPKKIHLILAVIFDSGGNATDGAKALNDAKLTTSTGLKWDNKRVRTFKSNYMKDYIAKKQARPKKAKPKKKGKDDMNQVVIDLPTQKAKKKVDAEAYEGVLKELDAESQRRARAEAQAEKYKNQVVRQTDSLRIVTEAITDALAPMNKILSDIMAGIKVLETEVNNLKPSADFKYRQNPQHIAGWNIQKSGKYYKAYRVVGDKKRGVHIGAELEGVAGKIRAAIERNGDNWGLGETEINALIAECNGKVNTKKQNNDTPAPAMPTTETSPEITDTDTGDFDRTALLAAYTELAGEAKNFITIKILAEKLGLDKADLKKWLDKEVDERRAERKPGGAKTLFRLLSEPAENAKPYLLGDQGIAMMELGNEGESHRPHAMIERRAVLLAAYTDLTGGAGQYVSIKSLSEKSGLNKPDLTKWLNDEARAGRAERKPGRKTLFRLLPEPAENAPDMADEDAPKPQTAGRQISASRKAKMEAKAEKTAFIEGAAGQFSEAMADIFTSCGYVPDGENQFKEANGDHLIIEQDKNSVIIAHVRKYADPAQGRYQAAITDAETFARRVNEVRAALCEDAILRELKARKSKGQTFQHIHSIGQDMERLGFSVDEFRAAIDALKTSYRVELIRADSRNVSTENKEKYCPKAKGGYYPTVIEDRTK